MGFGVGLCRSFFNVVGLEDVVWELDMIYGGGIFEWVDDLVILLIDCIDVGIVIIDLVILECGGILSGEFEVWFNVVYFVCLCISFYWSVVVWVLSFWIVIFNIVMLVSSFWIFIKIVWML